jgi:hypothetical protein
MLISGSVSAEKWLVGLGGFDLIRVFKKIALGKTVLGGER